jgi:Flp pilus assembly protein TadD
MSNTFPKVSPDGRWIVFVKCRNGQLMRPDSRLYIVPAGGGEAREMRCNTPLMNSWHSFSPNGRWLVFSSKSRSPYTQMYLTHIDEDGNDSPAILVENSTAANRAVNLPEFVNVAPDGFREIGGPAIDYFRRFDRALYLQKQQRYAESAEEWKQVLALKPEDLMARNNLGIALLLAGRRGEAVSQFQLSREMKLRRALEKNPAYGPAYNDLGRLLLETGKADEAAVLLRKAAELQPGSAAPRANLAKALAANGKPDEALVELRLALEEDPRYAPAHVEFGSLLDAKGEREQAMVHWRKALETDPEDAEAHGKLASALYARGQLADALEHWRAVLQRRPTDVVALRQSAWVLATSPDPAVRNGSEAVALAVRALQLSHGKDPAVQDVLAAAYAETQRFEDAALTAHRAIALATEQKQAGLAEAIGKRLALYEAKTPFRTLPSCPPR